MDQTFVYVAQLPLDITEEKLRAHFSACGKVDGVQLAKDPATGRFRGFAFVNFSTSAEAKAAIKTLNGSKVSGSKISVTEPPRYFPDLPDTKLSYLLRGDFSDEKAWLALKKAATAKYGEFKANLKIIDGEAYKGLTPKDAILLLRKTEKEFLFLADPTAQNTPDMQILVLDRAGLGFRAIATYLWEVENNLAEEKVDFDEFAEAADDNGTFRGFPK